MIVLDTNVISELMRSQPHPKVLAWVAAQPRSTLYASSISRAEILYGVEALPQGRRRAALAEAAAAMFDEDLASRVLPFGDAAASRYAQIVVGRKVAGAPIDAFDALIAATAFVAGAAIATRDSGGFAGCGLTVINPWDPP
jgi:predicted nucleic acid-binding protein